MLTRMFLRLMILLAAVGPLGTGATRAAEYASLEARAARFFAHREWASAGAMYTLMLNERPDVPSTYGHAIVSAGMLSDTATQTMLTRQALTEKIPFDSIFSNVERTSFSVGQTSLYEQYLLHTRSVEPWTARVIDAYLMRYYSYRRNPQGMIDYSMAMLRGLPDDEQALYTLAQGFLLSGEYLKAIATYSHIVQLNPRAYEALLYLGNYYANYAVTDASSCSSALLYLRRAFDLRPTPRVAATVKRLEFLEKRTENKK